MLSNFRMDLPGRDRQMVHKRRITSRTRQVMRNR